MTTKDITPEYEIRDKEGTKMYVFVKLETEITWRVGYRIAGITYVRMFVNGKLQTVNVSMIVEHEFSFKEELCKNEFDLQFP